MTMGPRVYDYVLPLRTLNQNRKLDGVVSYRQLRLYTWILCARLNKSQRHGLTTFVLRPLQCYRNWKYLVSWCLNFFCVPYSFTVNSFLQWIEKIYEWSSSQDPIFYVSYGLCFVSGTESVKTSWTPFTVLLIIDRYDSPCKFHRWI